MWRLGPGPALDPVDQGGWELLEVRETRDVLAVLRVVLEPGLEPVQGRDPEKVHLGVAGLADRIQHETEGLQKRICMIRNTI